MLEFDRKLLLELFQQTGKMSNKPSKPTLNKLHFEKQGLTYYFKFHDNNKVKYTITKYKGKNHGIEKEYDSTGKCIYECKWIHGKNVGWVSKL
jgi:antitoxin component YwqK of YwqJK toxin-antitoxin module